MSLLKPSAESCYDICEGCLNSLNDPKNYTEKNLFRSNVSQTEVRALQSRMLSSDGGPKRKENDPHLLAEVLQTTFRDMQLPLMHEVYEDITRESR